MLIAVPKAIIYSKQ